MLPRTRAEVPDFDVGSRPELRDAERASIYGNMHAVLRIGSHWLFAYVDAIARQVTKEYIRERDRVMRSSIERRVQLVRDILDGATIDAGELGYDPQVEH